MASCWTEMLCLDRLAEDRWRLEPFSRMWLGSIYDLVPEDQRYDANGDFNIPETWEGHTIVGLGDNEYLETDEDIRHFLDAVLEEGDTSDFIHALNTVARAKGMTEIAAKAGVSRASLYKSLADGGKPRFDTISKVVEALGCRLAIL